MDSTALVERVVGSGIVSVTILTERKPPVTQARTRKQLQGENSRELILDATERLMGTRGYAATSISDICKACGLPASSIYWHFGSKDGVLAAVMERGATRFFAAIPPRAPYTSRLRTNIRSASR